MQNGKWVSAVQYREGSTTLAYRIELSFQRQLLLYHHPLDRTRPLYTPPGPRSVAFGSKDV